MAETMSMGTLFPPELVTEVVNKVRGKSSIAALSDSEPIPFTGTEFFTFSLDKEADLVAENGAKTNGGATLGTVKVVPYKLEYGARVSDELMRASEKRQIQILRSFTEGCSRKMARALDIIAFHGVNPRTNLPSELVGTKHIDAQTTQVVAFDASNPSGNIEAAIQMLDDREHETTGLAMSPLMRSALARMTKGASSSEPLFPELAWGNTPDTINGLRADSNSTVSYAGHVDRAIVGNFRDFIRWGYAEEVPMEIIPYGNPDNDSVAGDLKGHNQVYLRVEMYIGFGILDPTAFARVVAAPGAQLTVAADVPTSTDLLGKTVDQLQSGVWVGPTQITGRLKAVTGYTGFSGDVAEQSGHYLVTHSTSSDGATIKAELLGGTTPEVTLDADGILITRVTSNNQRLKITATKAGMPATIKTYDLSALVLE